MMIINVFFICIILNNFNRLDGNCEGGDGISCCSGFRRDSVTNLCIECTPGYYGINCSQQCPFPSYGRHCQRECNCSSELCDVSIGCLHIQTSPDVSKTHNIKPSTRSQNRKNSSFGKLDYYTASSVSNAVEMYTSKQISQMDSKTIQFTVLGDIRPILYAIFFVILLTFILIFVYIIRKKIKNSQCNKNQTERDENVHGTGIYQEINNYDRFDQNISYSVCRENNEEALGESSELIESQGELESNGGKVIIRESTEVKSTSVY